VPIDDLPLGAHLTTPRRGFVHHGIYVGGGRVVHYAGFSRLWQRGPVQEITLERFAGGRGYMVKAWVAPRFAPEAVIERARSRLGEDRYRLWSNNCEHFCEWCIGGASRSNQVDAWRERVRAALVAVVAAWRAPRIGRRALS
jgi:hypothetical protein